MESYGNPNVMLVRNESSTDMSIVAMLATCSPVTALQVQQHRGGGGLEDAVANCGQKRAYYHPVFEAGEEEDMGDDCSQQVEKKRRLSFDQVRSLEKNFEIENKLEPERKMQLARELGLQPRQVAVWFQNRRARWKIKQLERDYEVLNADFNRLKSEFDAVLLEKEELESQRAYLMQQQQQPPQHVVAEELLLLPEITKEPPAPPAETSLQGVNKETSSGSISSELLNADSPRTSTTSCVLLPLPTVNFVDNVLDDQLLSQLHGCHRIMSSKPEDSTFQDETSCNYMLAPLDEDRSFPWWDWQ